MECWRVAVARVGGDGVSEIVFQSSSKIFLSYVDIKGREVNSGSAREGELEDKDIKYNIGSHSFWLLLYLNGATTCGTNDT